MANTFCAPWLGQYTSWHAANRHAPDAKYLVYTCRPVMPMIPGTSPYCSGFGDRFRLIAYMLRSAAYHRRVLLVDWASPVDVGEFFTPPALAGGSAVEWRLTKQERAALSNMTVERWVHEPRTVPTRKYLRVVGSSVWQSHLGQVHESLRIRLVSYRLVYPVRAY